MPVTRTPRNRATKDQTATTRPADAAPMCQIAHADHKTRARIWQGDCRDLLPQIPEVRAGEIDLIFADPPFNWKRAYDEWHDDMPEDDYLNFMFEPGRGWIDQCVRALKPTGSLWINIPDTWAAEIVCYLNGRLDRWKPPAVMTMVNWCVWHYRFGQNTRGRFINSKVHALYFCKDLAKRTWNPEPILEASDRATTYFDPRTLEKRDGMPAGLRVPLDVWYGPNWGRVQGNNKERRSYHDNQLPEVYLERVIEATSNPGDVVLDPFLGSGTTGVVAHALRRHFIGTEFSIENAKLACERIKNGPIRPMGAAKGMSSAIFAPRKAGEKSRARIRDAMSKDQPARRSRRS